MRLFRQCTRVSAEFTVLEQRIYGPIEPWLDAAERALTEPLGLKTFYVHAAIHEHLGQSEEQFWAHSVVGVGGLRQGESAGSGTVG